MNKIPRIWSRIGIVLIGLGAVLYALAVLTSANIYIWVGSLFLLIALYIKFSILKCPTCGWGGATPQWSKNKTIHCPKCGSALEYDK